MTAAITSTELRDRLASQKPPWILDVRTPPSSRPRTSTGPTTCRSMCSTTTALRSPNTSTRARTSCWSAGQVNAPARPPSFCRAPACSAGRSWKTGSPIGKAGVRRQPWRPAMGAGAAGSPRRRLDCAVVGARQRRIPATQMAGRGDRRRSDLRRHLQHLRDGHRIVEAAVQPRGDLGRSDGPVAARGALERRPLKSPQVLPGPPLRQDRRVVDALTR